MFFSFFSQLHLIKQQFVVLGNPKHVKAGLQAMLQYYKKDWSSSKTRSIGIALGPNLAINPPNFSAEICNKLEVILH